MKKPIAASVIRALNNIKREQFRHPYLIFYDNRAAAVGAIGHLSSIIWGIKTLTQFVAPVMDLMLAVVWLLCSISLMVHVFDMNKRRWSIQDQSKPEAVLLNWAAMYSEVGSLTFLMLGICAWVNLNVFAEMRLSSMFGIIAVLLAIPSPKVG